MIPTLRMRRIQSNVFLLGYHNPTKIKLDLTKQRHWRIPFRRPNVIMMSLSTSMCLQNIEKGRTRVDSRRMDSNIFTTIILGDMHSWVNQARVCIKKQLCLKVGINRQRRKRKEHRSPRKGLCDVMDVENHTC
jgi:hypothetical protein